MRGFEKEKLVENLKYTALHVSKVNDLVKQYHRIHRVPFHSLSAILTAFFVLLLLWSVGIVSVVHTVADKVGSSIVNIEYIPPAKDADNEITETTKTELEEEKPIIDLSAITNFFTAEPKYSSSGVFKYAIVVGIFDTIFIFGLVVAITYGVFYGYHYYMVTRSKEKLHRISKEVTEELKALDYSFIPEEYWHVPYLERMIRYIEQGRAEVLPDCLDLIDLEIRHKQIVNALVNNEWVDPKALSESILHPRSKVLNSNKQDHTTNLSN